MIPTLHHVCVSRNLTIACAESMTGGALSASITQQAHASTYFLGGVVAYSTHSKIEVLGVASTLIEKEGVYSHACVHAMALGVQRLFKSDIAIAVSGEAQQRVGEEKSLLEVYSCIVIHNSVTTFKDFMSGSRMDIIQGMVDLLHQRCIALIERGSYGQK